MSIDAVFWKAMLDKEFSYCEVLIEFGKKWNHEIDLSSNTLFESICQCGSRKSIVWLWYRNEGKYQLSDKTFYVILEEKWTKVNCILGLLGDDKIYMAIKN